MGYGWVSYGFGLAFFFPIVSLSYISAHVNPAFCLALWVMGDLRPGEFFALAASEFAGMLVGACLMWVCLVFLPGIPSMLSSGWMLHILCVAIVFQVRRVKKLVV